jgi:branched-chain amino acid transport system substrate-binding protein
MRPAQPLRSLNASRGHRAALMLALAAGCGRAAPSPAVPSEVRIGILPVLTGPHATTGTLMMEGARLAVDETNRAGGLQVGSRRVPVVLIAQDTRDTEQGAVSATLHLLNADRVIAVIGPQTSIQAIRVAAVTDPARMPMVTPSATHPLVTRGRRYAFRASLMDSAQAVVLARFAASGLHAHRLGLLYDVANPYNRDMAETLSGAFQALGGTVAARETYTTDRAQDFTAQLQRIRAANVDVLVLPNYTAESAMQMRQARALGYRGTFLGTDGWEYASGIEAEPAAEGAFYPRKWVPEALGPHTDEFRAAFRREYRHEPGMSAAATYDAVRLILEAVQEVGTEPDEIRDHLATLHGFRGVTGSISFSGSGDPLKGLVISRIRRGRPEVFWSLSPESLSAMLAGGQPPDSLPELSR